MDHGRICVIMPARGASWALESHSHQRRSEAQGMGGQEEEQLMYFGNEEDVDLWWKHFLT